MYLSIIKTRKIWFTFSGILIALSIVSLFMNGLNLGIDFTGGTLFEIKIDKASVADVNQFFKDFKEVGEVRATSSGENTYLARFRYIDNATHKKLVESITKKYPTFEELRYETIGPVIGADLKEKAVLSVGLAVLFMILYIAFAFRKIPQNLSSFKFGVVAVVALIHDVLITIGVFSVLGVVLKVEVDSLFVTALLTVMGFSVHDTIVVFDRIREHVIRDHKISILDAADKSINETMARSINTSLTTLITLVALFFFAGATIKFFVLALIVGIAIGTYSSIFLASPLLGLWETSQGELKMHESTDKDGNNPSTPQVDENLLDFKRQTKKFKKKRR